MGIHAAMSMSGDHCDALANTSLEVLQFGAAVAAACYVRAKLRAPAHPGAYALLASNDAEVNGAALRDALLATDDAEAGGTALRAVRAEVGPYWIAELAAGLVAAHKLLSLCAENARAHQRVPHPYPAVGGVASCLAYALVARLFAAVSSSPPGGGKRTRAGERAAAAALCAWCGLGVLFEATCPSDRFYVAPRTDAGGRDGEAAVRLVALSAGFAAALLAVAAPPAVELREAPATPEEAASLLSFVTFGYFTPVVDRGAAPKRYQLSGGDVPPVAPDAGAAACLRAFEGAFDGAPASAFWLGPALAPWDFWTAAAFQLGAVGFQFAPSLAIHALLAFLGSRGAAGTAPGATPRSVWLGLALLGLAPVGLGVCDTQRMMRGKKVGLKVQAAACAAVFRKALTVDPFGAKFSVGECVNLMATDARTLCRLFTFGHQLWAAPLQTAVAVAGLCFLIGWAALPGVAVVLVSMRCTTELTKRVKRRQRSMEQVRDRRLSLLSEYVAGVRVVKLFAWEADCAARVGALRREELGHLAWNSVPRLRISRDFGWENDETSLPTCLVGVEALLSGLVQGLPQRGHGRGLRGLRDVARGVVPRARRASRDRGHDGGLHGAGALRDAAQRPRDLAPGRPDLRARSARARRVDEAEPRGAERPLRQHAMRRSGPGAGRRARRRRVAPRAGVPV